MYVSDSGLFTFVDGTISENNSGAFGGGVYVDYSGTLDMKGGTISSNKADATAAGNGVYVRYYNGYGAGTFTMQGAAKVASDNDVYLIANESFLTVTDVLTGTAPVATITPSSYNGGDITTLVVGTYNADDANGYKLTEADAAKIAVTATPSGEEGHFGTFKTWKIACEAISDINTGTLQGDTALEP